MNSSYKVALVSAIVLCGAVLAYYLTQGKGEGALQSSPPRTAAINTVAAPGPPEAPTPMPQPKPVIKPKPIVAPKPAPTPVKKPPAPNPTRRPPATQPATTGAPPTITLDGTTKIAPLPIVERAAPPPPKPAVIETTPAKTTPPPPKIPPYVIRPGDTLISIAIQKYGHEKYWVDIAQANPLKDPTRLYPGDLIRLPNKGEVEDRRQLTVHRSDGSVAHIVRAGETLTGISKRYYRTTTKWRMIYNANREAIGRDPHRVQAATQLVIPRKPRVER